MKRLLVRSNIMIDSTGSAVGCVVEITSFAVNNVVEVDG
jgi:hypothetical protein